MHQLIESRFILEVHDRYDRYSPILRESNNIKGGRKEKEERKWESTEVYIVL